MISDISKDLFTLPIDMQNEDEDFASSHKILNHYENENNFSGVNTINDNICIEQIMKLLDDYSNNSVNNKIDSNDLKESKFLVFSNEKNNKYIKSLINSSRIYISDILEKNWKIKIKKIVRKMKLQYIQKLNSIENENENVMKNNNFNNNNNNYFYNNYNNKQFRSNQYNNNEQKLFSENNTIMNNFS